MIKVTFNFGSTVEEARCDSFEDPNFQRIPSRIRKMHYDLREQMPKSVMLEASGQEKIEILQRFAHASIPMPESDVARWSGDIAMTILLNL